MNHPPKAQGLVPISYHGFYLMDLSDIGPRVSGPTRIRFPNGLVAVEPEIATITTGIADGNVQVEVELHLAPPVPALSEWEEVVETSFNSQHGHLKIAALDANLKKDLPELTFKGPGPYRLRIHARGRDTAIDLAIDDVVESYLIQSWPNKFEPETTHKTTDTYGKAIRHSAKARP